MDVLVLGVLMGDDQGLMTFEAKVAKRGVNDLLPLLPREVLSASQRNRDVLDGLLGVAQGGGGAHENGRLPGVLQRELSGRSPQHPVGVGVILPPRQEVAGQAAEAGAAMRLADHSRSRSL